MHACGTEDVNDDGSEEEYGGNGKYDKPSEESPKIVRR